MNKFFAHNWIVNKINRKCILSTVKYMRGDLLDIGCGDKPYLDIIRPNVKRYIGLEHKDTPHKNPQIDIYGDACSLPFKDCSFDTVVSFQVMEHISEPDTMIKEIFRVLKNGGYIISTTPFMWGLHEEPKDFYRYTKYGLKHLFEKNKFEIIELKANSGWWMMCGLRLNYYLSRFENKYSRYILAPFYNIVQLSFFALDKLNKVETDTISYTLVAKKL